MNRIVLLLILAIAFAAPAGAQGQGKMRVVVPSSSETALRGTVGERGASEDGQASAPGDLSALVPAPLPALPTAMRSNTDAQQCRRSCAKQYYFCLAAEDQGGCSPGWAKCASRCGA